MLKEMLEENKIVKPGFPHIWPNYNQQKGPQKYPS